MINDTVPAYTELEGSIDCGVDPSGMSCSESPVSFDGSLEWVFNGALAGGSGGSVSYRVTIED